MQDLWRVSASENNMLQFCGARNTRGAKDDRVIREDRSLLCDLARVEIWASKKQFRFSNRLYTLRHHEERLKCRVSSLLGTHQYGIGSAERLVRCQSALWSPGVRNTCPIVLEFGHVSNYRHLWNTFILILWSAVTHGNNQRKLSN